ncbi:MAG: heparinase II/III family protein [Akkermansiaceae bacterium]|nr:heparinase II/III family protein [Akkermansiaceae bacterium]
MFRFFLCLFLILPLHAAENHLSALRKGHPRIMLTPQRVGEIRTLVTTDPQAKHWHELLSASAKGMLSSSPVTYTLENKKLLNESRAVLKRVSTLAGLHVIKPDPQMVERAKKELLNAAAFPDWNPASFLSTAEMSLAFAIGYDWLHNSLTPTEKETLRTAIIEKGLKPGLEIYKGKRGWPYVSHNWNSVCNNGLIAGALAIADTDPEIANAVLSAAKDSLPRGYRDYAPDGGWPEGPGYWGYGTQYAVYGLASLESALGTDWGLPASPGFSGTGDFRIDLIGPSGMYFNFADGGMRPGAESCMLWLANRFNRPDYDASERIIATQKPSIFHLVFFNGRFSNAAPPPEPPPLRQFTGTGVVILRSGGGKSATWLGIKAGDNKANHSNLDLGTFVLDAGGERFAEELGADHYTLPGYFSANRWDYYRTRTEGQNTLVIGGQNQNPKAAAEIISIKDASVTMDLTAGYPTAKKIHRTATVSRDGTATIDDRILLNTQETIVWSMHTRTQGTISGNTATLTRGNTTLKAEILSPPGASFTLTKVEIPPPQRPEKGLQKLSIQLPAAPSARLTIRFTPQ